MTELLTDEEIIFLRRYVDSNKKIISVMGNKEIRICQSLTKKGFLRLITSSSNLFLEKKSKKVLEKSSYSEQFYKLEKAPDKILFQDNLSRKRWTLYNVLKEKSSSKLTFLKNHALKLKINKLSEKELTDMLLKNSDKISKEELQTIGDIS